MTGRGPAVIVGEKRGTIFDSSLQMKAIPSTAVSRMEQDSIHTMPFSEIALLAIDSFKQSKIRFMLTALGMVIGTASLILVVTIGMTGKQYVLSQIQSIGANMIYAYYET